MSGQIISRMAERLPMKNIGKHVAKLKLQSRLKKKLKLLKKGLSKIKAFLKQKIRIYIKKRTKEYDKICIQHKKKSKKKLS